MAMVRKRSFWIMLLALCSLLLVDFFAKPQIHAATSSEVEPNDESASAQVLTAIGLENPVNAAIDAPGDEDWFSFSAEAGRTYTVELYKVNKSLGTAEGDDCTKSVFSKRSGVFPIVYNSAVNEVVRECDNNAGGLVQTSVSFLAGNSGTFYVQVAAHVDTVSGSYTLRILPRYDEPEAAWNAQTFEPNNQAVNAYAITPGYTNALTSTIEGRDNRYYTDYADVDWYRFEAVAGRTYTIELLDVAQSLTTAEGVKCTNDVFKKRKGLWLALEDPSFTEIERQCEPGAGVNVHTSLVFTAGNSGTYYFAVTPHVNSVSGGYSVRVLPRYDETGADWDAQTYEPNNRAVNAHLIEIGRLNALRSSIASQNSAYSAERADRDWYRFPAIAGETYVVEVYNVATSLSTNEGIDCTNDVFRKRKGLWLNLLDPARNEVARECDNNGSGDVQTSIQFTAGNSGTYHLGVTSHADSVSGDYSVRVRYLPCLSPTLQTSKAECEALTTLYEMTGGDTWTDATDWLNTNTPCTWHGVGCNDQNQVTSLRLHEHNLTGTLPPQIGDLSQLKVLHMKDNQLSGTIPGQLGGLTNLTWIELQRNQFTGTIPTQLGNLTNLNILWLGGNQLTGAIPEQLGQLANLQSLKLRDNQLTGGIPVELGRLSNLQDLILNNNQLSGSIPSELAQLGNLERLELHRNELSGTIPAQIGNLSKLRILNLSNNQLTGRIPSELSSTAGLHLAATGRLTVLEELDLSRNQLEGEIPTELTTLTTLTKLSINYNRLSASDEGLISFLDELNPGWAETQTPEWNVYLPLTIR
jgi:hypothetical protein